MVAGRACGLEVTVDGMSISAASITSYNGAAGTFTLAWAPDLSEQIRVRYQGR